MSEVEMPLPVPIRDSSAVAIARMALRHAAEGEAFGGPCADILALPRFVTPFEVSLLVDAPR